MIIDIILGKNVDTQMWLNDLKEIKADNIVVIDYDSINGCEEIEGVIYLSPNFAKEYLKKFDSKNYYKSLYGYPGMSSNTSSLFKDIRNES